MIGDTAPPHDLQLCQANTTVYGGEFSSVLYGYDQFNNITDKYEYDYGSAPAIGSACPGAPLNYLRHTKTTYEGGSYTASNVNLLGLPNYTTLDVGGTVVAQTRDDYDGNPVSNAPSIVGHDNANYAGGGFRGNVTNHNVCLAFSANNCAGWAGNGFWYDIAGNVVQTTDAKNNATSYSYNDSYSDGQSRQTYAHATTVKNTLGQTTTAAYDYNTGQIYSQADPNGVTTVWNYNDNLNRLTLLRRAAYGNAQTESRTSYSYPNPTTVRAYQDINTTGDGAMVTQTLYDGLGRVKETDAYETPSQYLATTQTYDALGRVATTTNPSRITNGSGDGLGYTTNYSYDELGRTTKVTTADGAVQIGSYGGTSSQITDPAGKSRYYVNDALGRIVTVQEDPGSSPHLSYGTTYAYDALDCFS